MKKIYMSHFRISALVLALLVICSFASAQNDSLKTLKRLPADSSRKALNMDAVYNRPFLGVGKLPLAIGGYLEANTQYAVTDGVTDGFSFQMRRLTLFFSSTIARRIKFLSELEFEDGTKEINIEFAAIDVEVHPLLNFRGGIVMNPIGAFNQNHDGPRWDFIDRPVPAVGLLPATLSNVGFGLHGKYFMRQWIFGYETYLTNGFDNRVIANEEGRTSLAAGKQNPERFEESNSGLPMFTGKIALRNRQIGELGLSLMDGVYNKFQEDGLELDRKRKVTAMAVDFNTSLLHGRFNIVAEAVKILVDVPPAYGQTYGNQQAGAYLDLVGTVVQRRIGDWDKAKINLGVRLEYADYNQGKFSETGTNIGDELWCVVPSLAFRPVGSTVFRFNYRYQQHRDLLDNPPARTGIIQFGFSSYF